MKDYYRILECTPMSNRDEIKRNYRRLAQQFHPDKNADSPYATAKFHDIKEAYETLTQTERKNAWLQERWLHQVMNRPTGETEPLTPYRILDNVLKTEKYLSAADAFRIDRLGVVKRLEALLSDEHMECLRKFDETEINRSIIYHIILSARPFPLPLLKSLLQKLEHLGGSDPESLQNIELFKKKLKTRYHRDRYTLPLVMLVTLLVCLLIYFVGRP